ncbi:MAG: hypothetical protein PHO63_02960 [Bacilli bacterium]|nr:hypothetical protein [Bacilli bacterium]MDD4808906.1 hypothetical protein [Bacilli bacterium]
MKIFSKILFLIALTVIFVASSYSWFADRATPSISENQIQVTSAEGLYIKLSPDSIARTTVNLNAVIDDFAAFELKQASSADGFNFYNIDFKQGLSVSTPEFIKLPNATNDSVLMIENGYIDYDFYLQTETYAKHIYIHKDSVFSGPAANSLRVGLTLPKEDLTTVTYIFGRDPENGVTDPFTTQAIIKAGQFNFQNIDPSFYTNQIVRTYANRNGGRGTSDFDPIDLNKILTTIPANTLAKINLKIWIEGGDIHCTNAIASTYLDFLLKFGSANVLLDAPVLVGNPDYSITGLTTDMEWADDNTGTTIWTSVVSNDQKFTGKPSVYVRIKEVVGVSPQSYATLVEF